ncbi:MAG: O-antigen ligase family protein [SAR202 cluster bacterium]|nr:O-antigen ligase family protein [SAR202 cluster bacterium]
MAFTPLVVNGPPFLPHTFFPFVVGKALYSRTLIEIAFGLWIVLAIRSPEFRVPRSWLIAVLAIYLLVSLLASMTGVSLQRSLWSTYERMQGWVDLAHWLAFVLVVGSVFKSWSQWRLLLNVYLVAAFFIEVLGVGELLGVSLLSFINPEGKLHISLGNSTYVGAYHLVVVLIAGGLLVHSYWLRLEAKTKGQGRLMARRSSLRRKRRGKNKLNGAEDGDIPLLLMRVFWGLVVVLGVVMVLQSGTRGALIGLGSGVLVFAIGYVLWGSDQKLRNVCIGIVCLLLGMTLLIGLTRHTAAFERVAANIKALDRLSHISLTEGSFSHRLNSAEIGLKGWSQKPFLGWGPENFTIAYDKNGTGDVFVNQTQSFDQAHNKLVEELTTKGAIGLLSYMSIWVTMYWIFRRRARVQLQSRQIFTLFVGSALVGYFVQNLALFDTPGTVGQFMLLVGFALYLDTTSDEDAAVRSELRRNIVERRTHYSPIWGWAFRSESLAQDKQKLGNTESIPRFSFQVIAAAIFVVAIIFTLNIRAFNSSRTILGTMDPSKSWATRMDYFEKTVGTFPQLANYPRIQLFQLLAADWENLNDQDKQRAIQLTQEQSDIAFDQEPQEWRLYAHMAGLYQRMGPSFHDNSRVLVDKVSELSPERLETIGLQVSQSVVEKDYETAYQVIDQYVNKYPEASTNLAALRKRIDQVVEAVGGG